MVSRIDWPDVAGRSPSPFMPGVEEPLAVTLLETPECSIEQHQAFEAIRNLSRRPYLNVLDGTHGCNRSDDGVIPLRVEPDDARHLCKYYLDDGIMGEDDWGFVISGGDLTNSAARLHVPVEYLGVLQVHRG